MITQQNNQSLAAPNNPRAFINVIFFDEQFKAVDYKISMVGSNKELKNHYTDLQNLQVPKNGFVYIYCSNESPVNVFFDNLQVVHSRGAILEETHYYPFGLTMAGISSMAAGGLENRKQYNGIEHTTDLGINQYDAFFRNADPQIGRWWQIDPKPNELESPYVMMGNNPISRLDPLGDKDSTTQGQKLNVGKDGMITNTRITQNRINKLERHPIGKVNAIILHRTVSSNTSGTLNSFKTRGVGTHFLVGKDGTILQTASLNSATSHLRESQIKKGFDIKNNTAIGIEVVGNYDDKTKTWEPVTPEQANSAAFLVNSLEQTFSLGSDAIHNHEDVQPKTAGEGGTVFNAISPFLENNNGNNSNSGAQAGVWISPAISPPPNILTNPFKIW